jgi:hypothetical protein
MGAFSVSLAVKNLQQSREFYEQLEFVVVAGDPMQNWLILRNGTVTIGLFQGMFERNMLTFNPPGSSTRSRTYASISVGSSRRGSRSRTRRTRAATVEQP